MVINDATKEAFEDFLGFNYEKNIEFEKKTLRELYDILNLAEKYQVKELRDVVCDFIQKIPLSVRIQFESVATAEQFSHFDDASQALFASRVAFTRTLFTNVYPCLTFGQRHNDETSVTKLLKDEKVSYDCSNCREKLSHNNSHSLANDLLVSDMMVRTKEGWGSRCRQKLYRLISNSKLCRVVSSSKLCRAISSTSWSSRVSVSWSIKPLQASSAVSDPFGVNRSNSCGNIVFKYISKK